MKGGAPKDSYVQELISEVEELLKPFNFKLDYQKGRYWVAVVLPNGYRVWFGSLNELFFFMQAIHKNIFSKQVKVRKEEKVEEKLSQFLDKEYEVKEYLVDLDGTIFFTDGRFWYLVKSKKQGLDVIRLCGYYRIEKILRADELKYKASAREVVAKVFGRGSLWYSKGFGGAGRFLQKRLSKFEREDNGTSSDSK